MTPELYTVTRDGLYTENHKCLRFGELVVLLDKSSCVDGVFVCDVLIVLTKSGPTEIVYNKSAYFKQTLTFEEIYGLARVQL